MNKQTTSREDARTSLSSYLDASRAGSSFLMAASLISAWARNLTMTFSSSLTSSSIRVTFPSFFSSRSCCVCTSTRFFSAAPASHVVPSHDAPSQPRVPVRRPGIPCVRSWRGGPTIRTHAGRLRRRSSPGLAFWYSMNARRSARMVSSLGVISSASSG